jgi:hypothetical protein
MRKQQKYHFLLFALLTLFVSSCNLSDIIDDDDDKDDDPDSQVMTAKINGESFSAVENEDTFIQLDEVEGDLDLNGDVYELSISALDFGSTHLTTINLALYGDKFSELKVGSKFDEVTEENVTSGNPSGAIGVVSKASLGNGGTEYGGLTLLTGSISVEITKLDKENEFVSGKFSFVAYDDDNDANINVTDGVFTNVEY